MTLTRLCAVFLAAQLAFAPLMAQMPAASSERDYSIGPDTWLNILHAFRMPDEPYVEEGNSPRLDELIHDGKLYLSLSDAIALALENNLDVAVSRFSRKIAETQLLRAKTGGAVSGVQGGVSAASTGASSAATSGVAGRGAVSGRAATDGRGAGGVAGLGASGGLNLDPVLSAQFSQRHNSAPTFSDFTTGTNFLVNDDTFSRVSIDKSFWSGAYGSLSWTTRRSFSNSLRSNFNPFSTSDVRLDFRQPLLQGFGRVNKISLRVARNNLESSDLQFKQQVIFTVASIQRLYWDLVRFRAEVESSREDLRLARQLYEGNRERVEIGKLAPIDLIESEAEVGQREQELTIALTAVREQEGTLKTALSKNGLASPFLLEVEVSPTDHVEVPATLEIKPLQELMRMALASRPDIAQARLQLENADILLKGTRNRLLPSVDLVASTTNNGLAGDLNPNLMLLPGQVPNTPDFFIGGLSRALGQMFRRNFPDYSVGLAVSIPLRNRRAQADAANALLRRRQSQLQMQQQLNEIRREVQSAVVGLEQAHARYLAARATRELREKMLDGEEQKFKLGYSDTFKVVQRQRSLAQSRAGEILTRNEFVIERTNLDEVTGQTLAANDISIDEAYDGRVSKRPDPIPVSR